MDNVHDASLGRHRRHRHHSLPTESGLRTSSWGVFNLQDGFGQIQPALEGFFAATMICTVVFTTMMLTMLPIPTSRGSSSGGSWTGWSYHHPQEPVDRESGVTAGKWWDQLPFGMGPVGWLNKTLNSIWGNDHHIEAVSRVNNRGTTVLVPAPGVLPGLRGLHQVRRQGAHSPQGGRQDGLRGRPGHHNLHHGPGVRIRPLRTALLRCQPRALVIFMMAIFGVAP